MLCQYLRVMMPQVVFDEIFDLQHRISEQAIGYISDELDAFRCIITEVIDNDVAVTIYFGRSGTLLEGEIRIDRLSQQFEIIGKYDSLILPISGDWDVVIEYLRQLTSLQ